MNDELIACNDELNRLKEFLASIKQGEVEFVWDTGHVYSATFDRAHLYEQALEEALEQAL